MKKLWPTWRVRSCETILLPSLLASASAQQRSCCSCRKTYKNYVRRRFLRQGLFIRSQWWRVSTFMAVWTESITMSSFFCWKISTWLPYTHKSPCQKNSLEKSLVSWLLWPTNIYSLWRSSFGMRAWTFTIPITSTLETQTWGYSCISMRQCTATSDRTCATSIRMGTKALYLWRARGRKRRIWRPTRCSRWSLNEGINLLIYL